MARDLGRRREHRSRLVWPKADHSGIGHRKRSMYAKGSIELVAEEIQGCS